MRFIYYFNQVFKNHSIRRLKTETHQYCHWECFEQSGCLSFNFTPRQDEDGDCELNNSEDSQHPGDLEQQHGTNYYASQVSDREREKKREREREREREGREKGKKEGKKKETKKQTNH